LALRGIGLWHVSLASIRVDLLASPPLRAEVTVTSDRMLRFRAVRAELQARRDASRAVGERPSPASGADVEALASAAADALYDRIAYTGSGWTNLANGTPLPYAVVILAVRDALPVEITGERRDLLAGVVASSATFRECMRRVRSVGPLIPNTNTTTAELSSIRSPEGDREEKTMTTTTTKENDHG